MQVNWRVKVETPIKIIVIQSEWCLFALVFFCRQTSTAEVNSLPGEDDDLWRLDSPDRRSQEDAQAPAEEPSLSTAWTWRKSRHWQSSCRLPRPGRKYRCLPHVAVLRCRKAHGDLAQLSEWNPRSLPPALRPPRDGPPNYRHLRHIRTPSIRWAMSRYANKIPKNMHKFCFSLCMLFKLKTSNTTLWCSWHHQMRFSLRNRWAWRHGNQPTQQCMVVMQSIRTGMRISLCLRFKG